MYLPAALLLPCQPGRGRLCIHYEARYCCDVVCGVHKQGTRCPCMQLHDHGHRGSARAALIKPANRTYKVHHPFCTDCAHQVAIPCGLPTGCGGCHSGCGSMSTAMPQEVDTQRPATLNSQTVRVLQMCEQMVGLHKGACRHAVGWHAAGWSSSEAGVQGQIVW